MNKVMIIWMVLFLGLSSQAFAKAGVAGGGFEFMLAIIGFLLLVIGLFAGTDFLIKNRKKFVDRFKAFLKKKILAHWNPF